MYIVNISTTLNYTSTNTIQHNLCIHVHMHYIYFEHDMQGVCEQLLIIKCKLVRIQVRYLDKSSLIAGNL